MHSSVPLLPVQAPLEAILKPHLNLPISVSIPLTPIPTSQLSPCTARRQRGEVDDSAFSRHNKQSCEHLSRGVLPNCQPIVRARATSSSQEPSVGVLERCDEGQGQQLSNHDEGIERGFLNEQTAWEGSRQADTSSSYVMSPSGRKNNLRPVPLEDSEDESIPGPAETLPPAQNLQPILASLAPETFAAPAEPPSLLVFSGGTAFNGVVEDLKPFTTRVSHVLPVSDDGGSTAEIVRVLGGPAVGDIRSRCLRLSDESSEEALAVKRLLGHRLPMDPGGAKIEWYSIVEGEHELWSGVSDPYKDTIRAFLVHFHTQILRHSSERFSFGNGSIGNFFFAGARTFFRSMDAAIFTYSSISAIPKDSLVLPAVSTNDRLVLGAELRNGEIIRGQNMISHPSPEELEQSGARHVNKAVGACPPLAAPIKRVFYMSTEGTHLLQEVFPRVNPNVVKNLGHVDAIIYGMGSLYTSICPSLVLRGVGEAIAPRDCPKVFLLNGTHDRETAGMAASDFVLAVCNALNRTHGEDRASRLYYMPPTYVTVFLVPEGGQIPVDIEQLHSIGITRVVTVPSETAENGSIVFNSTKLIETLGNVIANTPPALAD